MKRAAILIPKTSRVPALYLPSISHRDKFFTTNENARDRSPWRPHIVITRRSVDCRATGLRQRLTPTLLKEHLLRLAPAIPLRLASNAGSFSSSPSEPRPAFAVRCSSSFDRLRTHRAFALRGSSSGQACLIVPRLAPLADPSAPGTTANSSLRLCSFHPRRPAGNLRAFARGPSSGWACDELFSFTRTSTAGFWPPVSIRASALQFISGTAPAVQHSGSHRRRIPLAVPALQAAAFTAPCTLWRVWRPLFLRFSPAGLPANHSGNPVSLSYRIISW